MVWHASNFYEGIATNPDLRGRACLISRHCMLKGRCCGTILIERSFLHDDVQVFLMHDEVKIFQWIAVDQKQVGNIAFLHLTKLIAQAHHLSADARAALQSLVGRKAEQIDEMLEVACVVALRRLSKAVVSTDQYAHSAFAQLCIDGGSGIDDALHRATQL